MLIMYFCIVASQLKRGICFLTFIKLSWVMPRTIKQMLHCLNGKGIGKKI